MKIYFISLAFLFSFFLSNWKIVPGNGPEPRYINQLAYTGRSFILFGGKNSSNKGFNDLWEFKNDQWRLLGEGPSKRWDHSYTYLKKTRQLLLFGGRTFKETDGQEERVDIGDTWIYKNKKWTELNTPAPSPRSSHSMSYHEDTKTIILFGGRNKNEAYGDTWTFDGKSWTELKTKGPSKRYGHTLAYDPSSKSTYLFGGFDGEKLLNDFWVFSNGAWTELELDQKPSPRMAHAMQFNHKGMAIMFGGYDISNSVSKEMWVFEKGRWTLGEWDEKPKGRLSFSLSYDKSKKVFLLFGGSTGFNGQFLPETWKLDEGK